MLQTVSPETVVDESAGSVRQARSRFDCDGWMLRFETLLDALIRVTPHPRGDWDFRGGEPRATSTAPIGHLSV